MTITEQSDRNTLIGLPNPYVVPSSKPNGGFTYREQYYWDSYFIVRALIVSGHNELAVGMVDNLLFMLSRYGFVPNSNRFYMLSRSQPPLLSRMVRLIYENHIRDERWLAEAYDKLLDEYNTVWTSSLHPHNRQVDEVLSRYYDINMIHALAEAESGWDQTSRFGGRCLDFLPVDLNALIMLYEEDLAWMSYQLGVDNSYWKGQIESRKNRVKQLMWEPSESWFYDYDVVNQQKGKVMSLAAITPLLSSSKILSEQELAGFVANLSAKLETDHGLLTTSMPDPDFPTQWVAPNGWAPLHVFAVDALHKQGFTMEAKRIAEKWLSTIDASYTNSSEFYEKYNVVDASLPAKEGHYPGQVGFAWTNASFVILSDFLDKH